MVPFVVNRSRKLIGTMRNSGGVIIYIRNDLCINDTLVFTRDDSHVWVKLNGHNFGLRGDLFICLCYIVPSTFSRHVLAENNVYDNIIDDIVQIRHNFCENMCSFMLLGDLNSRVGNLHDYVLNDNCSLHHINLLPDDYDINNGIPRKSYDVQELIAMDICWTTHCKWSSL